MQPFKSWKIRTNANEAIVIAASGILAVIGLRVASQPTWEVAVSAVGVVALCAAIATAGFRLFATWQFLRESRNQPTDQTLWYRGVRTMVTISKHAHVENKLTKLLVDALCYRGVTRFPGRSKPDAHEATRSGQ